MAIDTVQKAISAINFSIPVPITAPHPDGTSIDTPEQAHFLNLYSGITPDSPVASTGQKTSLMLLGVGM